MGFSLLALLLLLLLLLFLVDNAHTLQELTVVEVTMLVCKRR